MKRSIDSFTKNLFRSTASLLLARKKRRRPEIELLEDRTAPSVTVVTDQLEYDAGETATVTASGFSVGETISVTMEFVAGNGGSQLGDPDNPDAAENLTSNSRQITDGGVEDFDGTADGKIQFVQNVDVDVFSSADLQLTVTGMSSELTASAQFSVQRGPQSDPPDPTTVVTTDKEDYAPGETVQITATGFAGGETVEFVVLHIDETPNITLANIIITRQLAAA